MARLPTGAKLFLILSGALLPLALIALFAGLQTTRVADLENRAELRVAAGEAARTLGIELVGDINALRSALATIEADPGDAPSCARTRGVFARGAAAGARFAIIDATGVLRCGVAIDDGGTAPLGDVRARLVPDEGLVISIAGSGHKARAIAFFPTSFLADAARPSGFMRPYAATLRHGDTDLVIRNLDGGAFGRRDRITMNAGLSDLTLEVSVPSAPITSPVLVAMFLPVVMWAAGAAIGWFVVDRLLIRPLRRLGSAVATYRPGTPFEPPTQTVPAQEIRELGATFQALSRTIAAHEAEVAEGMQRQTRLTREVHHRVKNNLQVIASLINFHSRSAAGAEAVAAYATIQRRVDALAVVHRHHFAELEESRGLGLRPVIGELAANLRATAPAASAHFAMTLEIEPLLVSQDTAVAVAFLVTELIELAMSVNPTAQAHVSMKLVPGTLDRAVLRVNSPALVDNDTVRAFITERYGRVTEGLARQLRSKLEYEPLIGAYEIRVPVLGRD